MVGKYNIRIATKKIVYEFIVKRKYTIIKGDSSTGKTQLYNMVNTPIVDKMCRRNDGLRVDIIALPRTESAYAVILENTSKSIIIIDEGTEKFGSKKFIEMLQKSDNYFIIITRKKLGNIPFSVNEIFEIETSKKYNNLKKMYIYNTLKNYYSQDDVFAEYINNKEKLWD